MFITRVLAYYVRRKRIPGKIDIGKHREIIPVTLAMKKKALDQLYLEQANLDLLSAPYLSTEEEECLNEEVLAPKLLAKFEESKHERKEKKMFKNYYINEHLEHLNVLKKWE